MLRTAVVLGLFGVGFGQPGFREMLGFRGRTKSRIEQLNPQLINNDEVEVDGNQLTISVNEISLELDKEDVISGAYERPFFINHRDQVMAAPTRLVLRHRNLEIVWRRQGGPHQAYIDFGRPNSKLDHFALDRFGSEPTFTYRPWAKGRQLHFTNHKTEEEPLILELFRVGTATPVEVTEEHLELLLEGKDSEIDWLL